MSETVDPRQRFLFSTLPGLLSQAYDYVRSNPLQATADVAQAVTPGGALQDALVGSEQISRSALRGDIGGMVGGAGAMGAGLLGAIPIAGTAGRGIGAAMRAAREVPEVVGSVAQREVSQLSNRMLEAPPPMVGGQGGVNSETVKRFLEDRNIPYTIQNSSSLSDNFGPSTSQYFRIATPDEIKTIRLSDHFYPSSSSVDLRYGAPIAQAENELASLLNLSVSQDAKNFNRALDTQRAEAELIETQKRLSNAPKPETLTRQEADRAAYWERMREAEIRNEEIKRLRDERRAQRKSRLNQSGLLGGEE